MIEKDVSDEWAAYVKRLAAEALSAWNAGEMQRLRQYLEDDVVQVSPYIESDNGTLVGIDAIIGFNVERQRDWPRRELVDILLGVDTVTLLLRERSGLLTWHLDISPNRKVRKIATSYSVGADFGAGN